MGQLKHTSRDLPDPIEALEARMVVLEIISMSALAMVLDTSENADPGPAQALADLILETVDNRCNEMGLTGSARHSATDYAHRLLGTAVGSLYPQAQ